MGIRKYKYYFAKPKSEIVKDIFYSLAAGGAIIIALTSPYFVRNLVRSYKEYSRYPKRKISDVFYRLRKQGLINIETKNNQIHISLTEEGRKKAGIFQINNLKIRKPKKWDGKWRLLIFDISQMKRAHREALRGKLKELGFCLLQKSVWVHPFDCSGEIDLLRDFFGLSEKEMRLIIADSVGENKDLKKFFKI